MEGTTADLETAGADLAPTRDLQHRDSRAFHEGNLLKSKPEQPAVTSLSLARPAPQAAAARSTTRCGRVHAAISATWRGITCAAHPDAGHQALVYPGSEIVQDAGVPEASDVGDTGAAAPDECAAAAAIGAGRVLSAADAMLRSMGIGARSAAESEAQLCSSVRRALRRHFEQFEEEVAQPPAGAAGSSAAAEERGSITRIAVAPPAAPDGQGLATAARGCQRLRQALATAAAVGEEREGISTAVAAVEAMLSELADRAAGGSSLFRTTVGHWSPATLHTIADLSCRRSPRATLGEERTTDLLGGQLLYSMDECCVSGPPAGALRQVSPQHAHFPSLSSREVLLLAALLLLGPYVSPVGSAAGTIALDLSSNQFCAQDLPESRFLGLHALFAMSSMPLREAPSTAPCFRLGALKLCDCDLDSSCLDVRNPSYLCTRRPLPKTHKRPLYNPYACSCAR